MKMAKATILVIGAAAAWAEKLLCNCRPALDYEKSPDLPGIFHNRLKERFTYRISATYP